MFPAYSDKMRLIFCKPDIINDYDYFLSEFLKSEHVSSQEEWLEIFMAINCCSKEFAQNKFALHIDVFVRNAELNFIEYIDSLIKIIDDTICLSYDVLKSEFKFVFSFKQVLIENKGIIEKIAYDDELNNLIIIFNNDSSKFGIAYKAFSENGECAILMLNEYKDLFSYYDLNNEYSKVWSSNEQISFIEKIGIALI